MDSRFRGNDAPNKSGKERKSKNGMIRSAAEEHFAGM